MKVPLEPSGGGGAGRKLFWFLTGTTLGTGGALVYASKDEKARELIETNVPNAKPLIDGAGQFSSVLQEYYQKM